LTECFQGAGGNAVAATYIIISPERRKCGYGTILMSLLEQHVIAIAAPSAPAPSAPSTATTTNNNKPTVVAPRHQYDEDTEDNNTDKDTTTSDYHYMYLWTQTAISFYQDKCGYRKCQRTSLVRKCLKSLDTTQVSTLEHLLVQRTNKNNKNTIGDAARQRIRTTETILLPPTTTTTTDNDHCTTDETPPTVEDVWLCKRLVEHVPAISLDLEPRLQQLQKVAATAVATAAVSTRMARGAMHNNNSNNNNNHAPPAVVHGYYHMIDNVPWEQQIGPSCGIAAIRMVQGYYSKYDKQHHATNKEQDSSSSPPPYPSLLKHAIDKGWTVDGELFDVNHLYELAVYASRGGGGGDEKEEDDRSLFHCNVQSVSTLTPYDIYQGLIGKNQFKPTSNANGRSTVVVDSKGGDGGFWILPYDANPRTKLPSTMFQGHHAHYGIIIGIMVVVVVALTDSSCSSSEKEHGTNNPRNTSSSDQNSQNVVQLLPLMKMDNTPATTTTTTTTTTHDNDKDEISVSSSTTSGGLSPRQLLNTTRADDDATTTRIFVLVQHSLSKELCIAPWHEFVSSNQQLISYDASKHLGPATTATGLDLRNRIVSFGPNHHHTTTATTTSMSM
jgi:hypothetical protein